MSKTSAPRGACVRVLGMTEYSRRANGSRAHSLPAARGIPNLTVARPYSALPISWPISRPATQGLLLGQSLAQAGKDELGDQPADVAAVPGDFLDQAGA